MIKPSLCLNSFFSPNKSNDRVLISIVGYTATGKTKLAYQLAEKINQQLNKKVAIISADSRQIYRNLPILTGADIPASFTRQQIKDLPYPYYINAQQNISLHGLANIEADQTWSLGQFQQFVQTIINYCWLNNIWPMVVGGTGLYQQHLFNKDQQIKIKPNKKWRQQAESMSLEKLQQCLAKLNPTKWQKMNTSDRANPRRLVRAVEIALAQQKPSLSFNLQNNWQNFKNISHKLYQTLKGKNDCYQQLKIGLKLDFDTLQTKIKQRVASRWQRAAVAEVKQFLQQYPTDNFLHSATGVKEITSYLSGEINQQQCLDNWTRTELAYAKRQKVWWQKQKNIHWFNANEKDLLNLVWQLIGN